MRAAGLVTRSGFPSTNLAPRGFCSSSKPRTINGGDAAGGTEDLVTGVFAAAALTVDLRDLVLRFVMMVLLKCRRAPVGALWQGLGWEQKDRLHPTGRSLLLPPSQIITHPRPPYAALHPPKFR